MVAYRECPRRLHASGLAKVNRGSVEALNSRIRLVNEPVPGRRDYPGYQLCLLRLRHPDWYTTRRRSRETTDSGRPDSAERASAPARSPAAGALELEAPRYTVTPPPPEQPTAEHRPRSAAAGRLRQVIFGSDPQSPTGPVLRSASSFRDGGHVLAGLAL